MDSLHYIYMIIHLYVYVTIVKEDEGMNFTGNWGAYGKSRMKRMRRKI